MPDAAHQKAVCDLLREAEAIVNQSTAHARSQWERNHSMDWVMSVIDEEGYPAASMITASRADGFKWISFCTGLGWNKPNRVAKDPRTCIYLFEEASFSGISLVGKTRVITDPEVKKQMWYEELGASFKNSDDPNWCVLLFTPERYNIFMNYHTICGIFD